MSMEEDLMCKKKVRAAHRTSTTRVMGQVDTLIKASPVNVDELTLLQTNLSTKLTTREALNVEIVELISEDQLEEEIGRADEYTEQIQRTLLQICKALKTLSPTAKHPHGLPSRDFLQILHMIPIPLCIHHQIQVQVLQV